VPDSSAPDSAATDSSAPDSSAPDSSAPDSAATPTSTQGTRYDGFDQVLGLSLSEVTPDRVLGQFEVQPHLHQPYGILHGGVLCSVVEATASTGGATWFRDRGHVVGVSNSTNFLRATRAGVLQVEARPIHRGRTSQLWQVTVHDAGRRLVATGQVRLANITDPAALQTSRAG